MSADRYALGHGSTAIHVEHYDLDLGYKVTTNRLAGTATLRIRAVETTAEIRLDLAALSVDKVTVTGARLRRYHHGSGRLLVRLAEPVEADQVVTVTVRYAGYPRPVDSPWGEVGWEELEEGVLVAGQPTGAPSWFPCNDRPADKSTYTTRLTVDHPYVALAHGRLVSRRTKASSTTWVFEEEHPTAAYLATVQIGQYVEIGLGQDPVPQRALVPAAHRAAARDLLSRHDAMMALFTERFGPYPFAGYTVVVTADELEIPLEAQGLAVFGSNHLAPSDGDERLVPHELAHQWFGNSVTVASWQHLWLNEGFACYAEWLWSPHGGGPGTEAMARRWHERLAELPQDLVLAAPEVEDLFDDRVYKRGALTLHALRTVLGEDVFWAVVHAWTSRHRDGVVTTEDFREIVDGHADNAGGRAHAREVGDLLDAWLDRAPLPDLPRASGSPRRGPAQAGTDGPDGAQERSSTTAHPASASDDDPPERARTKDKKHGKGSGRSAR